MVEREPCSFRHAALDPDPVPRPARWLELVQAPQTEAELTRTRECIRHGRPFGGEGRSEEAARRLGLESSLRPRGRPRKAAEQQPLLFGEQLSQA